jgi:hypothetical protein
MQEDKKMQMAGSNFSAEHLIISTASLWDAPCTGDRKENKH